MSNLVAAEGVAVFGLFSLMTGAFSAYIQETFKEDMILRRYYLLLVLMWIRLRKRPKLRNVLKPLGLCVYCLNFWVASIVYTTNFQFDPYQFPLFIGGSFLGVLIANKLNT